MAHPLIWPRKTFYYPIGNTSPVCMTQDIPPEKSANILLLGCGDARNILFTIHASGLEVSKFSRRLDFTCCDQEPAVLARNVILLTLIADGEAEIKGPIWSIFYDFYFDSAASGLLSRQCRKLLDLSTTLEIWRQSKYGHHIKMSTSHTLEELRRLWKLWADFVKLPPLQAAKFKRKLKQELARASEPSGFDPAPVRSAGPLFMEAIRMVPEEFDRFWRTGLTNPDTSASAATLLNPTFAYSASEEASVHYGTFPIGAFHLAPAFVLFQGSTKGKKATPKALFAVAQAQLDSWGKAYRRCVANARLNLTIRLHVGDAIAFCKALGRRSDPTSEDSTIYTKPWGAVPLILDEQEYAASPVVFDVIDTSNLADHLGYMNILLSARPLLPRSPYSVLYTETLHPAGSDPTKAFSEQLCGNVDLLSLFLDLAPVSRGSKLATFSNLHELWLHAITKESTSQFHERTTWKIVSLLVPANLDEQGPYETPKLEFDPLGLAQCLYGIYIKMFSNENLTRIMDDFLIDQKAASRNLMRRAVLFNYTRESFVLLTRLVQVRVTPQEWQHAITIFLEIVEKDRQFLSGLAFYQDMLCRFYSHRVYTVAIFQPGNPFRLGNAFSPSISAWRPFHRWSTVPSCVWITLQVPRANLRRLEDIPSEQIGSPTLQCEVRHTRDTLNAFSTIQSAFGTVSKVGTDEYPGFSLNEDVQGWSGTAPLVVWFQAPAWLLGWEPDAARVTFGLKFSMATKNLTSIFGKELLIYSAKLVDVGSVFVSPAQPIVSGTQQAGPVQTNPLPVASKGLRNYKVQVMLDQASQSIATFTRRLDFSDPGTILILANPKTAVSVGLQQYPSSVTIKFGEITHTVDFPLPVDGARTKLRVARKSRYIEIIAFPSTPNSPGGFVSQNFPMIRSKATLTPWNVHRLNLDHLPSLQITQDGRYNWFNTHVSMMMSESERSSREAGCHHGDPVQDVHQSLWELKDSLHCILTRVTGIQGERRHPVIALNAGPGTGNWTLLFFTNVRMDLLGHTVVLDGYFIPLSEEVRRHLGNHLHNLSELLEVQTSQREVRLWKDFLPAAMERCRQTWVHQTDCAYFKKGYSIPLSYKVHEDPVCGCGAGKDVQALKLNKEWAAFAPFATRIAISPLFAISKFDNVINSGSIEKALETYKTAKITTQESDSSLVDFCGGCQQTDVKLLGCSRCKTVKYCSTTCQKDDWKNHKSKCNPIV